MSAIKRNHSLTFVAPKRIRSRERERAVAPNGRGGALLAVLWLSAALSAIAFSVASTVRSETERAGGDSEGLRAQYLASGSIDRAILWILWGAQGYTNPDGSPRYFSLSKPIPFVRFDYPSGVAVVEKIAEGTKLNINQAPPEQIHALLLATGADPDQAVQVTASILDWRSGAVQPPSLTLTNPDQTFRPRHASFEEIEEVLLVKGMTPELFYGKFDSDPQGRLVPRGGLRDAITVWGRSDALDVNNAAPVQMAAIGIPPQVIDQIIGLRPIRTMDQIAPLIAGLPYAGRLQVVTGAREVWTLRSTARLRGVNGTFSDVVRSASATVSFGESGYTVLRWRDEAVSVIPRALQF